MPSRPPAGIDWVRAIVFGLGDLKEFSNDFWFSVSAGSISSGYNYHGASQAIYTGLTTAWQPAITTSTTLRGVQVEYNDGTGTVSDDFYDSVSGTGIGNTVPEDVAVIVRKRTANHTASGKGRWYFCGAGTADCNGSYLNSSGITDWQAAAIGFKTAITFGGVTFSPAHFSAKTGLLYPIVDTPVVGLLGTRRRRRGPF